MNMKKTREDIKKYYGEVLTSTQDLVTKACCPAQEPPAHLQPILNKVHPDITARSYGCGSPIPDAVEGCSVLDLGCGTGQDVFVTAKLTGPSGSVLGVDMTESQLEVGRQLITYHQDAFEHQLGNIDFKQAYIEDLSTAVADASVDVVISNCVINLSPDKEKVFEEIFRVLKPGGELLFADIFSDRRIPEQLQNDPLLRAECLGGALYLEDFRRMLARLQCPDYRTLSSTAVALDGYAKEKLGMAAFFSMTQRVFKLELEDRCENYGQVAYYQGTVPFAPHEYRLDDHHLFPTGMPVLVCGNTASMLAETRYNKHFRIVGDRKTHYGLFPCECSPGRDDKKTEPSESCC